MGSKWITAGAGGVLHPHVLGEVDDHFSFFPDEAMENSEWFDGLEEKRTHMEFSESETRIQTFKFCTLHHSMLALSGTVSWSHLKFFIASYKTFLSTSKNTFKKILLSLL